jgi:hypothetical protein
MNYDLKKEAMVSSHDLWSRKKSKTRRQSKKIQMHGETRKMRRNEAYSLVRRNDLECSTTQQMDFLRSRHDLFRKGEIVTYEGQEAKVIGVKPLLIIKLENRILCGALHNHIEPIK